MSKVARAKLGREQTQLLLTGKAVRIRLPGVDISEIELSLDYVSDEERKKIADKFAGVGKKPSFNFDDLGGSFKDIFGEMFK